MIGLTKRQRQVMEFVQSQHEATGLAPTLREIAAHFRFKSSRAAADHLDALKRKGFLESELGKARSLRSISPVAKLRSRIVDIPLFGTIPAGNPQMREQEAERFIPVDAKVFDIKRTATMFALEVKGDSMIGRNICDGDVVLFEFRAEARDGQIVAALIDGENTLKTYVVRNGKAYLKAENPKYPNLRPAEELTIQGVFKALIRKAKD